jgi:lysophospholipase L1-like esterase
VRLLAIVLALSAAATVLAVAGRRGDDRSAQPGAVTLVGDSLNVGVEPYLPDRLAGWSIDADDEVGRTTEAGLAALEGLGAALAPVVVVSLGTNDPQADVEGFRDRLRRALALTGPDRCVVWPTIWRGGANDAFNEVLAQEAEASSGLHVVDWVGLVERRPELMGADGVHPTEEGYAARAEAIAETVRSCA